MSSLLWGVLVAFISFAMLPSTLTAQTEPMSKPPIAKKDPVQLEKHGDIRTDEYYWLRNREDAEVIAYLEAENSNTKEMLTKTEGLQEELLEEFKGRIKQTDISAPYKEGDYYYYDRTEDGKDYPIYCRKKDKQDAPEEVILDVNELAQGHDFYKVGGLFVSPDQNLIAYGEDTVGRRLYTLRIKNLTTGEIYKDAVPGITSWFAWASDNKTIFYTHLDSETLRWDKVYRHTLGDAASQDVMVFEETDETFYCYVYATKSREYLLIESSQTLSYEYRYLSASDPTGDFQIFTPRERGLEYQIDNLGDAFFIRTNLDAKNFRIMKTPVGATGKANWEEVIAGSDERFISSFELFDDYLVVSERKRGLIQMRIHPWEGEEHYLDFGEPTYTASFGDNYVMASKTLRFEYSSLTTPESVFDYQMDTRERTLLKQKEVLGGFDSSNYESERLYAIARDGTEVPISLVYRKGVERNGGNPLLLYGYGSYGYSMNARFSPYRISLLDRGFVYAIAHIRGGQEMGRAWYEDGKLLKKKNTFTDFIDCGDHLIKEGFTNSDNLFISGGSAGGLLIGAVINMRPDLFKGAVAAVPFVDVITTMLDDDIPLTTSEYDEWGNPNEKEFYDYMLSYSPYDNVEAKAYPNLLVVTSLHDSQVQYWEPAKWVARLRDKKTGDNMLLLKTYMEAGHGGTSGRTNRYREIAFEYAFLVSLATVPAKTRVSVGSN